jgi:hypothetical protein
MKKKFNKRRAVAAAVAASTLALLTGCGSASNAPAPAPVGPAVAGIGGGCVPINQTSQINFQITGMYIGSQQMGDMRVLAGLIPPGDQLAGTNAQYGTMIVSPTPIPQTGYPLAQFQGQRVDGTTIQLSVTAPNGAVPTTNPYQVAVNSTYNASGVINVSPTIQNLLVQTALGSTGLGVMPGFSSPGYYPYGQGQTAMPQVCVSNLAFSLQRTLASYANWLYLGNVYFYLNGGVFQGGQHGLAINF